MIRRLKEKYKEILFKLKYKKFNKKIEKAIKKKRNLIIKTDEKDKQTGKTTALVSLSKKYNIPILVKSFWQANYIKKTHKHNNIIHAGNLNSLRGLRRDIVLVEEGFDNNDILFFMKNFKAVIGFKYENTNH